MSEPEPTGGVESKTEPLLDHVDLVDLIKKMLAEVEVLRDALVDMKSLCGEPREQP